MPAVLRGVGGDALEEPVVIPAEREEDVAWAFQGVGGLGKGAVSQAGPSKTAPQRPTAVEGKGGRP